MNKFVIKVLMFISPLILAAFPLDIFLSKNFAKSNDKQGENQVWRDIYSGEINCDIAIYGSSRAWVHFDSEILEVTSHKKVYNFGIDGHNFWLQYLRHIEYLKHNKKPKVIILSLDVFSFEKRRDLYQSNQFLPYMLWNKNLHEYTSSYIGFQAIDYYVPLIRYSGKLKQIETALKIALGLDNTKPVRSKGFKSMELSWNDDFAVAKERLKNYEVKLDKTSVLKLQEFINECISNKIHLIFVYSPEYVDGQEFVINRHEVITLYDTIAQKNDIPFFNYSNDEICQQKEYFYNASHLNSVGSRLFTYKLIEDLKKLMRLIDDMEFSRTIQI